MAGPHQPFGLPEQTSSKIYVSKVIHETVIHETGLQGCSCSLFVVFFSNNICMYVCLYVYTEDG